MLQRFENVTFDSETLTSCVDTIQRTGRSLSLRREKLSERSDSGWGWKNACDKVPICALMTKVTEHLRTGSLLEENVEAVGLYFIALSG